MSSVPLFNWPIDYCLSKEIATNPHEFCWPPQAREQLSCSIMTILELGPESEVRIHQVDAYKT